MDTEMDQKGEKGSCPRLRVSPLEKVPGGENQKPAILEDSSDLGNGLGAKPLARDVMESGHAEYHIETPIGKFQIDHVAKLEFGLRETLLGLLDQGGIVVHAQIIDVFGFQDLKKPSVPATQVQNFVAFADIG